LGLFAGSTTRAEASPGSTTETEANYSVNVIILRHSTSKDHRCQYITPDVAPPYIYYPGQDFTALCPILEIARRLSKTKIPNSCILFPTFGPNSSEFDTTWDSLYWDSTYKVSYLFPDGIASYSFNVPFMKGMRYGFILKSYDYVNGNELINPKTVNDKDNISKSSTLLVEYFTKILIREIQMIDGINKRESKAEQKIKTVFMVQPFHYDYKFHTTGPLHVYDSTDKSYLNYHSPGCGCWYDLVVDIQCLAIQAVQDPCFIDTLKKSNLNVYFVFRECTHKLIFSGCSLKREMRKIKHEALSQMVLLTKNNNGKILYLETLDDLSCDNSKFTDFFLNQ
jgi:hypothetical protein